MLILGIDTSLPMLSVALLRDKKPLASIAMEGSGSRNEKLLPSIDWLLSESGIRRDEIGLVAVTRGPGSFTGVRIGLATAQGLCFALGIPLLALSTHEAASWQKRQGSVVITGDAGRSELFASVFSDGTELLAPHLGTLAQIESLEKQYGPRLHVEELSLHVNIALLAAARAEEINERGAITAWADATPIYVRLAEAEVRLNAIAGER